MNEQPTAADVSQGLQGRDILRQYRTYRKVSWVLLPIVFLAAVLNYLDRSNLAFAALELNADLGFTPVDYGIGAGAFYLGYGVAHVPSTCATMQLGARWWFGAMTIAWGIVATSAAAIRSRTGLVLQRLLLGITEAGCYPTAFHLLLQFYPKHMATKPFTAVSGANVLSVVFAAPLAAGLMSINAGGLKGWQWLFILEGIPSVLLGIVMLVVVPNGPLTAWFLTPEERQALHHEVHGADAEAASKRPTWSQMPRLVLEAAKLPLLWYFAISGFAWVMGIFSLNSWMAIIIKNMLAGTVLVNSTSTGGSSSKHSLQATLLSAIPYLCAAIGMWWIANSSHRFREKDFHIGIPWVIGGVCLAIFEPLYKRSFAAGFSMIVIAIVLAYCTDSVMFARVAECLDARHAGVGVAIYNAIAASVGGFLGPFVVGGLVQRTGSFVSSMVVMGGFLAFAGLMMVALAVRTCTQQRRKVPVARDGSEAVNSRTDLLPSAAVDKDVAAAIDVELAKRGANHTGA